MKLCILAFGFLGLTTSAGAQLETRDVKIGKFQSRAIFTSLENSKKSPVIILIPGSGANGPEEMMPKEVTGDGEQHSLFKEISEPFQKANIQTLALGKPGIEFFTAWPLPHEPGHWFYDLTMYQNLKWSDLIENVHEAVQFLKSQQVVDPDRIYLLGHSEGTQVAVDYAHTYNDVAAYFLLGYAGEDFSTILDWQLYRRVIDLYVSKDVDINHDGFVSKDEAQAQPDFHWDWKPGQEKVSYAEIEANFRASPILNAAFEKMRSTPLYSGGIFNRGPIYKLTATVTKPVYIFNGAFDVQTPPEESLKAKQACIELRKKDCYITIIPDLTHGFSRLRGTRRQVLLDATLGPVDSGFQNLLFQTAKSLP